MRPLNRSFAARCFGVAAILAAGCSDSAGPFVEVIGAVEITVSTLVTGADLDADGYVVSVDSGPGKPVSLNDTVRFGALTEGLHLVRLDGLAPNCSVTGANPQFVIVRYDIPQTSVLFSVSCRPKNEPGDSGAGGWDY